MEFCTRSDRVGALAADGFKLILSDCKGVLNRECHANIKVQLEVIIGCGDTDFFCMNCTTVILQTAAVCQYFTKADAEDINGGRMYVSCCVKNPTPPTLLLLLFLHDL